MMPYWQNRGLTVGDHGADKYGEHQNGALDIMVPDIATGNSVLQQALKDPNVYGIIFNNQVYGYGQGMTPRDYSGGHTGNPTQDHQDHVHIWYKPHSMYSGGPTPSAYGPVDGKGGHLAIVHPNEFMISARGRATVPDSFLHALNQGVVDPAALPKYAVGGSVAVPQGMVAPPPPQPVVAAQMKVVPPPTPTPVPAAPMQPSAPPPQTVAGTPPPSQQPQQPAYTSPQITRPTNPGPAPSSINHNLPALSKGISSAASAIGQALSTAIGAASGAAAGASGIPGLGAIGAIGPYVAGYTQQVGKVVDAAVNVVSSSLVGNVPGSFGDPNAPAYGQTLRPDQNRPATASYRRSGDTNNFYGYDASDVLRMKDNSDALKRQATLATVRV
jgi:hypothetical protein